ncbi:MAG TPA: O-antigen ligase family protein [Saprospiraceae bacterium]|jgi:O-antigen ligase|nr:O-antigen ligase family protein [Saprospiraceae bacterium]WKZ63041.1 MAG: O-antigen ligase family protein [Saprospiraceae bacterium]HQN57062.1 O-antigen ligase family protein [Saprospiraceae bacterium]HRN34939.1 O-antigen ligase family protein [Saprospiraceae bacterium]HRP85039.1 O-antigen ligase family protein [Saprospiraceae bacterium]
MINTSRIRVLDFVLRNFGSIASLCKWGMNAGVYLTISGLFASRFLIACGMIVMGCASLLNMTTLHKQDIRIRLHLVKPVAIAVSLLVLGVVTSFLGSEQLGFAMVRLRLYVAFLLIPLILAFAPPIDRNHIRNYLLYALSSAAISSIFIQLNYFQHYETISKELSTGKPIPTPIPHIRYGMFLSFTFLGGLFAFLSKTYPVRWQVFVLLTTLYLGFSILFLSVRTAWLVSFLGLLIILAYFIMQKRRITLISIVIIAAIGGSILAYLFIPSVKIKAGYTLYDWRKFREDKGSEYSDSERLYSLQNGWSLWKENKWLGVGSGDLHRQLEQNAIKNHYPGSQIPHNQWLMTLVCGGLLSLAFTLLFWYQLWRNPIHRKLFLFHLLVILYLVTFFFEPTFETSIGVLSFVFILIMILLQSYQGEQKSRLQLVSGRGSG